MSSGDRYVAVEPGAENYQLGPGDKIKVNVFNEETLSGEFNVGSEGTVSLPLIGEVTAKNKTPQQLATEVQSRLADGYLREPKVSVEVSAYRPFFILGEVKAPGQYPYASGMTVLNAVATAQGFTPRAARKVAFVRRAGASEEVPMALTPTLRVMPGDTIRLGERYF
ncbi:MAG TPA: polysaccharide biosynthesis/export family protein [Sphingobium sp.]